MILPFSTQLNGKPTYFVERIHKCFSLKEINMIAGLDPSIHYPNGYNFVAKNKLPAKLHTIREDKKNRWEPGTKIDFFINCRQKNMLRFAPVLPVVSIQKIRVFWATKYMAIVDVDDIYVGNAIWDRSFLGMSCDIKVRELAKNDGFDIVEDFFTYFNEDFTGKIIHWTNLKY